MTVVFEHVGGFNHGNNIYLTKEKVSSQQWMMISSRLLQSLSSSSTSRRILSSSIYSNRSSYTTTIITQCQNNKNYSTGSNHDDSYSSSSQSLKFKDTIFALSSGSNKAGVAVIRVSGRSSNDVLQRLTMFSSISGDGGTKTIVPRMATLSSIHHPQTKEQIDKAMLLWFPQPNSFTGEDVLELHVHGGRAVVHDTLDAIACVPGTRSAVAGEFTRRAFDNNKMDLSEVEGLSDLLDAQTNHQRRVALLQMQGSLAKFTSHLRNRLIRASAYTEAFIDFGDDAEIDPAVVETSKRAIREIKETIEGHLANGRIGERLREGASIAIVGPPNAGKSSLINILAQRRASIVSSIPGTTRDVVEVVLDIGGYPVVIGDTAGIRVGQDEIEQEGIVMAKERFKDSDISICVFDSSSFFTSGQVGTIIIDPTLLELINSNTIIVFNKTDLLLNNNNDNKQSWKDIKTNLLNQIQQQQQSNSTTTINHCEISCSSNQGIKDLLLVLENNLKNLFETSNSDEPLLTRLRHKEHLRNCVESLDRFLDYCEYDVVIAAEELRSAIKEIGAISHHVNVDDLLDVIFKDFCIEVILNIYQSSIVIINNNIKNINNQHFYYNNRVKNLIKRKILMENIDSYELYPVGTGLISRS
ncbi:GTP-binding protein 3 [Cavenderia fasciculata]|uniref:GTP-binding protein 3 n=1 Tax=Cavenderia fasciculata TaxID=261658 RepID=F4QDM3_CACFS|nr:GTP-binding protein 3 [Cavenderia fasciculata]EGG13820.1 GTP-binding protein 3 [Cavenderia fasciculata]|eukprot:XP_004350528.1 GTP-binding protein 3 [Cavenderia fasciculata]